MKIDFKEIEMAFEFVSFAGQDEHSAIVSLDTGEIYYGSEFGDSDELPDDVDESDRYVEVPHNNELDLGRALIREFISDRLPDHYQDVERIFSSRGAYSRYKDFVVSKNLLDQWHEYENTRNETVLKQWCVENEIELAE